MSPVMHLKSVRRMSSVGTHFLFSLSWLGLYIHMPSLVVVTIGHENEESSEDCDGKGK